MISTIRKFFIEYPDRKAFFTLTVNIFPRFSNEYLLIEKAYRLAKDAFREKYRTEPGVRYFEHLRAVALILILHLRVWDANVIVAALLHDIVEDIKGWDFERLKQEFNEEVALLVCMVSKKDKQFFDGSKVLRNLHFNNGVLRITKNAAYIKLADRLHNVITLWATDEKKQFRKIKETIDFYMPLAKRFDILVFELKSAVKLAIRDLVEKL